MSFLDYIPSLLRRMDATLWYIFIFSCFIVLWLLSHSLYCIMNSRWPLTTGYITTRLVYPLLFPRIRFIGAATRLQFSIAITYLVANLLIVTIHSEGSISSRAANMSMINLIPLLCGPRLSLITTLFGIPLQASIASHQWFGRTAVVQMLIHIILSLKDSAFQWTRKSFVSVVVSLL